MIDFGYHSKNSAQPNVNKLLSANTISVDIESSGINIPTDVPYGYSLAVDTDSAYFVNMHNRFFSNLVSNDNVIKLSHNAKFERSMFKKSGITINNWCDTIIAAHLLEENGLSLEALLHKYFPDINHKTWDQYQKLIPHSTLQELAEFFGSHAIGLILLWSRFQRELRAEGLWNCLWNIELPLIPVLSDMELRGAYINTEELKSLGKYYDEKISILEDALSYYAYKDAGVKNINFNSSDQIADLFYEKLKIPKPPSWTYRNKKRPSVDKQYLEPYKGKVPIISLYLQYKAYLHLKNTYVTGILKRLVNGCIHTNFNQIRTRTGRLSSSDPNLQNIPMRWYEGKKIRRAFTATPDDSNRVILKADFDQMELRDAACWSNCTPLLEAFKNNEDVHLLTTMRMYNDSNRRPDGKQANFQTVYGGGSEEQKDMFFSAYPEIRTWTDRMHHQFEIFGYARTYYKRKRSLGNFNTMSNEEIAHAKREGISTIVQGSCAEIMKLGMRKVWNEIKDSDIHMILQVHDELVFDLPKKRVPDLVDILERNLVYRELQIPLTISISVGDNWTETGKYGTK